jgi:outer membrane immunogenic protein
MTRTLLLASAAIGTAMLSIGAAQAATPFDWSGFYAGIHAGDFHGMVHIDDNSLPALGTLDGFMGGLLLGYNLPSAPLGPLVLGVEADLGHGKLHGNGSMTDATSTFFTYDLDWDAHFRLRVGAPFGNILPFIAGGVALAGLQVTEHDLIPVVIGNETYVGGSIGVGIDAQLAPGLIGRIEGLYDKYATKHYDDGYSVDFSAWTARAALIVRLP